MKINDCGKHCISILEKNHNNIYFKTFNEDQNKIIFTFIKCRCKTHRICLMNYIYTNSDRKKLYCPNCCELILETENDDLLQEIAITTLLFQNIFLYKIQHNHQLIYHDKQIFEKLT